MLVAVVSIPLILFTYFFIGYFKFGVSYAEATMDTNKIAKVVLPLFVILPITCLAVSAILTIIFTVPSLLIVIVHMVRILYWQCCPRISTNSNHQ